jgi:hypothetical protein
VLLLLALLLLSVLLLLLLLPCPPLFLTALFSIGISGVSGSSTLKVALMLDITATKAAPAPNLLSTSGTKSCAGRIT